eukprot:1949300-Rhodomonas_salina.1
MPATDAINLLVSARAQLAQTQLERLRVPEETQEGTSRARQGKGTAFPWYYEGEKPVRPDQNARPRTRQQGGGGGWPGGGGGGWQGG